MATAKKTKETKKTKTNMDRVGIVASNMKDILLKAEKNKRLAEILGKPVLDKMALVSDNNDLRIEEYCGKELTKEEETEFVEILGSLMV